MYLELIIQQDKDKKFQAKCTLFPNAKAMATTKMKLFKNYVHLF